MRKDQPVHSEERARYGGTSRDDSHPAFGSVVVTRASGSPRTLFQSDLTHNETIRLSVHCATRTRSLNSDRVTPTKEIVEVEMSLHQWGALVSSMGIGEGTPVTIRRSPDDHIVPGIPYEPRIAENLNEVDDSVTMLIDEIKKAETGVQEAFEKKLGVKIMRERLRTLHFAIQNAPANAKFAVNSLKRAAEGTVSQAKSDIEAHILNTKQLHGSSPVANLTIGMARALPENTEIEAPQASHTEEGSS